MNVNYIPGPLDASLRPEASATRTANHNGAAQDFGAGFAPNTNGQPMAAVVNVTAADRTDTNETYTFKVQDSADNSTFADVTVGVQRTATGVFAIPFFCSRRYARVVLTVGGTTPSATYEVHFVPIQ